VECIGLAYGLSAAFVDGRGLSAAFVDGRVFFAASLRLLMEAERFSAAMFRA